MSKTTRFLRELFAPMQFRCVCCGKDVFDETGFCEQCKKDVAYNNGKTCKRCGVAIEGEEDYCGNCAFDKIYFDRAYSPFCYEGAIRDVILAMKFNNLGGNAAVLARYLVYVAQREHLVYDAVTYAPMSRASYKKRGYNQARLLAEEFCAILNNTDLLAECIVKVRDTEPQEKLSRAERKTNLTGSYRIHPAADVKGKRVLVIDDVKTTGATLNECAKALKRAGAAEVIALTVASRRENFDYEKSQE